jgi:hypothetical protein
MLNKENQMQIIEDGYGGNDDPIKTKAPKKVNVSINPETMAQLTEMKAKIAEEIGFTPSYSEAIQYLIKKQYPEQTDILS